MSAFTARGVGVLLGVSLATGCLHCQSVFGQQFVELGRLSGQTGAGVGAITPDGAVAAGSSGNKAFRWTASTGMVELNSGFAIYVIPYAISADGQTIVGAYEPTLDAYRPFRWTLSGGFQELPRLSGASSTYAVSVTADGATAVGYAYLGNSNYRAVRWTTSGGIEDITPQIQDTNCLATAISFDGTVIVGSRGPSNAMRAFRWVIGTPPQDLGVVAGASSSYAYAMSFDGSVVVGSCNFANDLRPFRWTLNGGMRDLGIARSGTAVYATGTNSDGSVVIGSSYHDPFVWTASTGGVSVSEYLANVGVNVVGTEFWSICSNPSGTVLGGACQRSDRVAWLVTGMRFPTACPANCDGNFTPPLLSASDFVCFLSKFRAGDPYANCDGSTGSPTLTAADFVCFLSAFRAGCP